MTVSPGFLVTANTIFEYAEPQTAKGARVSSEDELNASPEDAIDGSDVLSLYLGLSPEASEVVDRPSPDENPEEGIVKTGEIRGNGAVVFEAFMSDQLVAVLVVTDYGDDKGENWRISGFQAC